MKLHTKYASNGAGVIVGAPLATLEVTKIYAPDDVARQLGLSKVGTVNGDVWYAQRVGARLEAVERGANNVLLTRHAQARNVAEN